MEKSKKTKAEKPEVKKPQTPAWEIKDRLYQLTTRTIPPVHIIKSRGMFYFDEDMGMEREIKYCRNQQTVFVDEMKGPQRLGSIVFRNGQLFVEKEQVILQKFLSLYHKDNGRLFEEYNADKEANEEVTSIEHQLEAMNVAQSLDVDMLEAVLRSEIGSDVTRMTSKELKRDGLIFAQNNPDLFLELANDENLTIRNNGIKAVERGIIKLSSDNRTFRWASTDKKLITVPFDENPYSALAAWFKTDEGVEVYLNVEKRLK